MFYLIIGILSFLVVVFIALTIFLWNKIRVLATAIEERNEIIEETSNEFQKYMEDLLNYALKTYNKFGVYSELNLFFVSLFDLFGIKVDRQTKKLIIPKEIKFNFDEDIEEEFDVFHE